jgi:hypothetical protein
VRGKNILWTTIILAMLLAALAPGVVTAPTTTKVYVDPPTFGSSVGQKIEIDVKIEGAVDVYAWEFKVSYGENDYVLAFGIPVEGPFLKSPAGTFFAYDWDTFEETAIVGCTRLGTVPGKSGDGTLCTLKFDALTSGTVNIDLFDVVLVDRNGVVSAPDYTFDGLVVVTVPPPSWDAVVWIGPPHGGKVWPDRPVAYPGDTQKMYARIRNTGTASVWVTVLFKITGADSLDLWPRLPDHPSAIRGELLPAATFVDGSMIAPGSVEIESPTFTVVSGYYYCKAIVYASAVGPLGPWVEWPTANPGLPLVDFAFQERHVDNVAANSLFDDGEYIYVDADASGTVSPGDIRKLINGIWGSGRIPGGYTPDSVVAAGDLDVGQTLIGFNANEKHREDAAVPDGLFSYDAIYWVYGFYDNIYVDNDLNGIVSGGDERKTFVYWDGPGYFLGIVVSDTDGALPLKVFVAKEKHGETVAINGVYDNGEPIYWDADADGTVSAGDTRLTAAYGYSAGSTVNAGDADTEVYFGNGVSKDIGTSNFWVKP